MGGIGGGVVVLLVMLVFRRRRRLFQGIGEDGSVRVDEVDDIGAEARQARHDEESAHGR